MGGEAQVTVFADTNLGTHIAFNAPPDITAASLKRDFEKAHLSCLPDIGEIQVNGLMVKRKSLFYNLPDSFPIKFAFPAMLGTWFLHVEVKHLKRLCTPCSPCDEDALSKHKSLMICKGDNARCNSEEKKTKGFQPGACLVEEHEITNIVSKKPEKNEISHENQDQNAATGMSEGNPCMFGDKPTSMAKSSYVMPEENKLENLVELYPNSMQSSHSKMSTQLISVTGIINKYFTSFNGIDNFSSSSNSDLTSRAVHSEIEVHSKARKRGCLKIKRNSLPRFAPKTCPRVLHTPLVSKKSGSKNRKLKPGKRPLSGSKGRKSRMGTRLLSASRNLGVSITKHDPTIPFRILKDSKLLQGKSQMKGSIFSISGSDDD
ncbi:uncharacterized protein LOC114162722 isoform X1 [Vigna unguiculata]|uniref:Uncharacterized protein n=2 Tax=Vigna unguiculata TaxID=3917 RepID=A0A4D6NHI3_VIGUN|nr:uncharacterized protein LOC114162722 isoform X1 [Vigna unguiculata]QCE13200.1 hypothetical protein DEO72_LG11g193 [Vigna unguiculata]